MTRDVWLNCYAYIVSETDEVVADLEFEYRPSTDALLPEEVTKLALARCPFAKAIGEARAHFSGAAIDVEIEGARHELVTGILIMDDEVPRAVH